jgi:polysaccharide export outer membrane protein
MRIRPSQILRTVGILMGWSVLASAIAHGQQSATPPSEPKRIVPYRIITNDRLGVHIFQEDDLGITARVDSKGDMNLNMVGEVHVAGQTLEDAERTIEAAYVAGQFLRNPKVTLTVEELAPREISVQGYVKSPGRYPLPIETATTLVDMISKAGGLQDTAWGTRVRVTRIMPDGGAHVFEVDVDGVMKGKIKDKDKVQAANMILEPGDVIYVPERII